MERESAAERGKVSGVLRMRALGHLAALSAHVQRMSLLPAARLDDAALAAQEKGEVQAGFTISFEISQYTRYFGFIGGVRYFFYRPKWIF